MVHAVPQAAVVATPPPPHTAAAPAAAPHPQPHLSGCRGASVRRRAEEAAAAPALPGETIALPAVGGRGRRAGPGPGGQGRGCGAARGSAERQGCRSDRRQRDGRLGAAPQPPLSPRERRGGAAGAGRRVPGRGRPGREVVAGVRRARMLMCQLTLRAASNIHL